MSSIVLLDGATLGAQRERIAPEGDVPLYRELTGHEGVFDPTVRSAKPPVDDGRSCECTALRAPESGPAAMEWIEAPQDAPRKFNFPETVWARCACGRGMCHPQSIVEAICRGCAGKQQ